MSIINCNIHIPFWYIVAMICFSLFHGIRDLFEQSVNLKIMENNKTLYQFTKCERVFILYIQGFIFKFATSISSFMALWIGYEILLSLKSFNDIGVGTAILLIFLFAWGIIGAGGYLTSYISKGKFPGLKS